MELEKKTMNRGLKFAFTIILSLLAVGVLSTAVGAQMEPAPAPAQTAYQPKFRGDPAKSDSEYLTLGYLRTVTRAEKVYFRRHQQYASSLLALAGTASFTKRMARGTQRGDYTIHYRAKKDSYQLSAIPQQFAPDHRAFYADEDGKLRVEQDKPAGPKSPLLK